MAQQEDLPFFVVRSCIVVCSCIMVTHVWFCWDDLVVASVGPLKRSLQTLFSPTSPCTSFDTKFWKEFDKVRVARGRLFFEALQVPGTSISLLTIICMSATSEPNWGLALSAVFVCARYLAIVYYSCYVKFSRISAVDMTFFYRLFMSILVLWTYFTDTDDFLMNGGLRCGLRVVNAVMLLDCRTSVRWNAFFSAVVFLTVWQRRDHLCIDGRSGTEAFVHYCMSEVATCACVCAISVFLETCEQDRIKASLDTSQSGRAYLAIQRMLSVFCDAHLRICLQSNIIAHSPHLVHLLGSGDRKGEIRSTLRGDCFLRYVEEDDRQRFQDFISAAAVPQSDDVPPSRLATSPGESPDSVDCALGPATSIQVSLRKDGGAHLTPVELFLIHIPNANDAPEFLMGIRETGEALPHEACTDAPGAVALQLHAAAAPAREPDLERSLAFGRGPGAQAAPGTLSDERLRSAGAALAPVQEKPPLQGARAPGAPWQAPEQHVCQRSRSSLSSSSGRSSSASGSTARGAGQVSSVCLLLDSATPDICVQEMLLRFEVGPQMPCLRQWLPRNVLARVQQRCQALVNAKFYGGGEDLDSAFGAVQFCRRGSAFLQAECAELAVHSPTVDEGDSDESESDDDPDMTVTMSLHGVSMFPMPWQITRHRISRTPSLYPIDESPQSSES